MQRFCVDIFLVCGIGALLWINFMRDNYIIYILTYGPRKSKAVAEISNYNEPFGNKNLI